MNPIPTYQRLTVIGLGFALLITGLILGKLLLVPLAWAVLFALMVIPIADWWERRIKYRGLASILTVLGFVLTVGAILFFLSYQFMGLADDVPTMAEKLAVTVDAIRHYADVQFGFAYAEQPDAIKLQFNTAAKGLVSSAGNTLRSALTTFGLMLVTPIYMFFLLRYRQHFFQFMLRLTAAKDKVHTVETTIKAMAIVQKYLQGAFIEVLVVATLVGTLFLILGIQNALFFAVFVALLNIIPYLGVFIGSSVSVVYAYLTTDHLMYPILVFVFLWVIQIIDNNLIVPYVVGSQIKLNPLAVILVVVLGGLVWGVSGMVLFIPFLGILKVVLDESPKLKHYGFLLGGT